jgi:lysophospholipase L1-like esterase
LAFAVRVHIQSTETVTMRTILKVVVVNLMLICLGIIIVELIFGAWFGYTFDPRLRVRQDVELVLDTNSLYPSTKQTIYRRDRWGLRGAIPSPDRIAIVTIGGSTTDQLYLSEGDAWQDRFAAAADPSRHLIVANAGLDGQSTVGHIAAIEGWLTRIPGLRPKFVLIYAGINDVFVETRVDRDGVAADQLWHRLRQLVEQRSAIVGLVQATFGAIEARRGHLTHGTTVVDKADAQWAPIPDPVVLRAATSQRSAAYADRLATLDRLVRAWGAEPIFVTQPHAFRRLSPTGEPLGLLLANGQMDLHMLGLGLLNEQMLATCRNVEAICLDLAGELSFGPGDFYDIIHYTPAGAAKIGRYLAIKLYPDLVRAGLVADWKTASRP